MAFAKLKKVVSPKGIAAPFPKITEVDDYQGQKAFKVGLILDPADEGVNDFIKMLDAETEAAYAAGVAELTESLSNATGAKLAKLKASIEGLELHKPYSPQYAEDGSTTGKVIVNFKRKAEGVLKDGKVWKHTIPVFDSKKSPIPAGTAIWGGSVLRCQTELMPFCATGLNKAGVSLRLFAVQVIEIEAGGDAVGDGFDVEDGYEASAAPLEKETVAAPEYSDTDESDF